MEIEDSEIFEITDYTNVNDWEKFISKLEDVITNMENSQLDEINNKDIIPQLIFDKFALNVLFYRPDLMNFDGSKLQQDEGNNLEVSQSLITKNGTKTLAEQDNDIDWQMIKWFGKRKFIVICPSNQTSIYGQSQIKQLISSIMVAVSNLKCQLPVLVKYGPRNWPLYEGVFLDNDFKGKLQSAVIKYTPKQCNHLSGIRRIFQEKLGKGYVLDDDINLSAKYLFDIDNCPVRNDGYFKGQFTEPKKMHFFQLMSAGFMKDPIKCLKLSAHWSKVSKETLSHVDHATLPVSTANAWYLSCVCENSYDGTLYKTLRKLLKSFLVAQKSGEILRDLAIENVKNINQPLLKLTKSPISNHHLFKNNLVDTLHFTKSSTSSSTSGPEPFMDEKTLQHILMYLFPDARQTGDQIQQPYSLTNQNRVPNYAKLKRKLPRADVNFLLHRLAVCLTNLLTHHKEGLKCFSFIWNEVVLELRFRLENLIPLPETKRSPDFLLTEDDQCINKDEVFTKLLQESMPHLGSCQLEQKLQLLNYCILTRLRNKYLQSCDHTQIAENSDSEEQFFDCESDEAMHEPRGRLRQFKSLNLINHPSVPLYVPITQVLPVDVVKRSKNNESNESLLHSHSASLVADMSAFKAANPGSIIEDFIRWYSPNDYLEEECATVDEGCNSTNENSPAKGSLSGRMLVADNTWLRSWDSSSPVPARLQKRLFDDTAAAENVLLWLRNLTIAEISSNLINDALMDSLDALVECIEDHDPAILINTVDLTASSMIQFFDATDVMDVTGAELEYYQSYDQLITCFQQIEYFFAVKRSLYHKIMPEYRGSVSGKDQIITIINSIISSGAEVMISKKSLSTVDYEYIFSRLTSLYVLGNRNNDNVETLYEVDKIFSFSNQKEYVISLNCGHPLATSRRSTQRMYVCCNEEEFRVATHMFEDLTYF